MADSWENLSALQDIINRGIDRGRSGSEDSKARRIEQKMQEKLAFLAAEEEKRNIEEQTAQRFREYQAAKQTYDTGRDAGDIARDTGAFLGKTLGGALTTMSGATAAPFKLGVDYLRDKLTDPDPEAEPNFIEKAADTYEKYLPEGIGGWISERSSNWVASDYGRARDSLTRARRDDIAEQARLANPDSLGGQIFDEAVGTFGDIISNPLESLETLAPDFIGPGFGAVGVAKTAGKIADKGLKYAGRIQKAKKAKDFAKVAKLTKQRNRIIGFAAGFAGLGAGEAVQNINAMRKELDTMSWEELMPKLPGETIAEVIDAVGADATDREKIEYLKNAMTRDSAVTAAVLLAAAKVLDADVTEMSFLDDIARMTGRKKNPNTDVTGQRTPPAQESLPVKDAPVTPKPKEDLTFGQKARQKLYKGADKLAVGTYKAAKPFVGEAVEEGAIAAAENVGKTKTDKEADLGKGIGEATAIGAASGGALAGTTKTLRTAGGFLDETVKRAERKHGRIHESDTEKEPVKRLQEEYNPVLKNVSESDKRISEIEQKIAAEEAKDAKDRDENLLTSLRDDLEDANDENKAQKSVKNKGLAAEFELINVGVTKKRKDLKDGEEITTKTKESTDLIRQKHEEGETYLGIALLDDVVNRNGEERTRYDSPQEEKDAYIKEIDDAVTSAMGQELDLEAERDNFDKDSTEYKTLDKTLNKLREKRKSLAALGSMRKKQLSMSEEELEQHYETLNNPKSTKKDKEAAVANFVFASDPDVFEEGGPLDEFIPTYTEQDAQQAEAKTTRSLTARQASTQASNQQLVEEGSVADVVPQATEEGGVTIQEAMTQANAENASVAPTTSTTSTETATKPTFTAKDQRAALNAIESGKTSNLSPEVDALVKAVGLLTESIGSQSSVSQESLNEIKNQNALVGAAIAQVGLAIQQNTALLAQMSQVINAKDVTNASPTDLGPNAVKRMMDINKIMQQAIGQNVVTAATGTTASGTTATTQAPTTAPTTPDTGAVAATVAEPLSKEQAQATASDVAKTVTELDLSEEELQADVSLQNPLDKVGQITTALAQFFKLDGQNNSQVSKLAAELSLTKLANVYKARLRAAVNITDPDARKLAQEGTQKLQNIINRGSKRFKELYGRNPILKNPDKNITPTGTADVETRKQEALIDESLHQWERKGIQKTLDKKYEAELNKEENKADKERLENLTKATKTAKNLKQSQKRAEQRLDKFIRELSIKYALPGFDLDAFNKRRKIPSKVYTPEQFLRLEQISRELEAKDITEESKKALEAEKQSIEKSASKASKILKNKQKEMDIQAGTAERSIYDKTEDETIDPFASPVNLKELSEQKEAVTRELFKQFPLLKKIKNERFIALVHAFIFSNVDSDPDADPTLEKNQTNITGEELVAAILNMQEIVENLASNRTLAGPTGYFTKEHRSFGNLRHLAYKMAAITNNLQGKIIVGGSNEKNARFYVDYTQSTENIYKDYKKLNALGKEFSELVAKNKEYILPSKGKDTMADHVTKNKSFKSFLRQFVKRRSHDETADSLLRRDPNFFLDMLPLLGFVNKYHREMQKALPKDQQASYLLAEGVPANKVQKILDEALPYIKNEELKKLLEDKKFARYLMNILPTLADLENNVRKSFMIPGKDSEWKMLSNVLNLTSHNLLTTKEGKRLAGNPDFAHHKVPLGVRTAAVISGLNWVARDGRKTILPTVKDIRAALQKQNDKDPITSQEISVFEENGSFYTTALRAIGTDMTDMVGIDLKDNTVGNMAVSMRESFGLLGIMALTRSGIVHITSKQRSTLGIWETTGKDSIDNSAIRFIRLNTKGFWNKDKQFQNVKEPAVDANGDPIIFGGKQLENYVPSPNNQKLLEGLVGEKPTEENQTDEYLEAKERPLSVISGISSDRNLDFPSFEEPTDDFDFSNPPDDVEAHLGEVSLQQKEAINKHRKTPHNLTVAAVNTIKRTLTNSAEKMAFLRMNGYSVAEDFVGKSLAKAKKMTAVNAQIERDYENLVEMVRRVEQELEKRKAKPGGENLTVEDVDFYFDHNVWSVLRMGIASNGFNPQGSKLHRNVIRQKEWTTDVAPDSGDTLTHYKLTIAEAFGVKVDWNDVDNSIQKFDEFVERDDVKAVLDILRKAEDPTEEITEAELEQVNALVSEMGEEGLSLRALQELTRYSATETFTSHMYRQIDGITNGTAFSLGTLSGYTTSKERFNARIKALQAVGYGVEHANKWKNKHGDVKNLDFYEQAAFAERVERFNLLNNIVPFLLKSLSQNNFNIRSPKVKATIKEIVANNPGTYTERELENIAKVFNTKELRDLGWLDTAFGTTVSLSEDGEYLVVSSEGRKLFKYPLMFFNYGAGVNSISASLANLSLEAIHDKLAELHAQYHKMVSEGASTKDEEVVQIVNEYNRIARDLYNAATRNFWEKDQTTKKSTQKFVPPDNIPKITDAEHQFMLKGAHQKAYFEHYKAIQIPSLRVAFDAMFPEISEAKRIINASAHVTFHIFNKAYLGRLEDKLLSKQQEEEKNIRKSYESGINLIKNASKEAIEKDIKKRLSLVALTEQEEKDIFNDLMAEGNSPVPLLAAHANNKSSTLTYESYVKILKTAKTTSPVNLSADGVEESINIDDNTTPTDAISDESSIPETEVGNNSNQTFLEYVDGSGKLRSMSGRARRLNYKAPGVSGLIKSIQSSDASAMVEILLKITAFNIHDAIMLGVHKANEGGVTANSAFYEILQTYNIAGEFGKMYANVTAYFDNLPEDSNERRKALEAMIHDFNTNPYKQKAALESALKEKEAGKSWAYDNLPAYVKENRPPNFEEMVSFNMPIQELTGNEVTEFVQQYQEYYVKVMNGESFDLSPADIPNPIPIFKTALAVLAANQEQFIKDSAEYFAKHGLVVSQYNGALPDTALVMPATEQDSNERPLDTSNTKRTNNLSIATVYGLVGRTGELDNLNTYENNIQKSLKSLQGIVTRMASMEAISPKAVKMFRGIFGKPDRSANGFFSAKNLENILSSYNDKIEKTGNRNTAGLPFLSVIIISAANKTGLIKTVGSKKLYKYTSKRTLQNLFSLANKIREQYESGNENASNTVYELTTDFVKRNLLSESDAKNPVVVADHVNAVLENIQDMYKKAQFIGYNTKVSDADRQLFTDIIEDYDVSSLTDEQLNAQLFIPTNMTVTPEGEVQEQAENIFDVENKEALDSTRAAIEKNVNNPAGMFKVLQKALKDGFSKESISQLVNEITAPLGFRVSQVMLTDPNLVEYHKSVNNFNNAANKQLTTLNNENSTLDQRKNAIKSLIKLFNNISNNEYVSKFESVSDRFARFYKLITGVVGALADVVMKADVKQELINSIFELSMAKPFKSIENIRKNPDKVKSLLSAAQNGKTFSEEMFADEIAETQDEIDGDAAAPFETTNKKPFFFSDADAGTLDANTAEDQSIQLNTAEEIMSVFEQFISMGNVNAEHEALLRSVLEQIISENIGTVEFQQVISEVVENGAKGAIDPVSNTLKMFLSENQAVTAMNKTPAEVFVHELMHAVIEFGIENNPRLRSKLAKLHSAAKEAFDARAAELGLTEPAFLFLDDPATATEAEKKKALNQYRYLFVDSDSESIRRSRALKEFIIYGTTNEKTREIFSKIPASFRRSPNQINTVLDMARQMWDSVTAFLSSVIHGRKMPANMAEEIFSLAATIATINENNHQRANFLGSLYKGLDQLDKASKVALATAVSPLVLLGEYFANKDGKGRDSAFARQVGKSISAAFSGDSHGLREAMYKAAEIAGGRIDGLTGGIIRELTKGSRVNQTIVKTLRRAKTFIEILMQDTAMASAKTLQKAFLTRPTQQEEEGLFWALKADITTFFYNEGYSNYLPEKITADTLIDLLENDQFVDEFRGRLQQLITTTEYGLWANYYIAAAESLGNFQITGQHLIENGPTNATNIVELAAFGRTEFYSEPIGDLKKLEAIVDVLASVEAIKRIPVESRNALSDLIKQERARPKGDVNGIDVFLSSHASFKEDSRIKTKLNKRQMFKGYTKLISDPLMDFIIVNEDEIAGKRREGYKLYDLASAETAIQPLPPGKVLMINRDGMRRRKISGALALNSLRNSGSFLEWDGDDTDVLHHGGMAMQMDDTQKGKPNPTNTKAQKEKERFRLQQTKSLYRKVLQNDFTSSPITDQESVYLPLFKEEENSIYTYRVVQTQSFRDEILDQNKYGIEVLSQMYASTVLKKETDPHNEVVTQIIIDDYEENYHNNPDDFLVIKNLSLDPKDDKELADSDSYYAKFIELYASLPAPARKRLVEAMAPKGSAERNIYIRKESLDLLFGYREGSITELYNGTSMLGKVYTSIMNHIAMATGGLITSGTVLKLETAWKDLVAIAKENIVIKGLDVLANNVLSNIILLKMRGLSWKEIYNYQVAGIRYIKDYNEKLSELQQLQHELTVGKVKNVLRHQKRIAYLASALNGNPVKDLVNAGAYQSIVEGAEVVREDYKYDSSLQRIFSPLSAYLSEEGKAHARNVSKTLFLTHDSELFQALKSYTQISDFVARYALHNHNMKHRKMSFSDSFEDIMETFIEYDTPHSKGLDYINKMGFAMFTKYLLRIQRVISKTLTEKPATTLLTHILHQFIAPGIPNILDSIALDTGTITNSMNNPLEILGNVVTVPLINVLDDGYTMVTGNHF